MVNSGTFFGRLISIDTLISFDGVVPSPADLQLKLISLIEQFNKALYTENQISSESESLCRALCFYFDKRLTTNKNNSPLSWQKYSLKYYFYGYSDEKFCLSDQLETLLGASSLVIFHYTWKLLTLLIQSEGEIDSLLVLRAGYQERYSSQARIPSLSSIEETSSWATHHSVVSHAPLYVFIIGPFAAKWFSQNHLSSTGDNSIVWMVSGYPNDLVNQLTHLDTNHHAAAMTFFPVLSDGFENSITMIEEIRAWQFALSTTALPAQLPCLLGFYTRLSLQRYSHDPDRAIWSGKLTPLPNSHLNVETLIANLISELEVHDDGNDFYAIQRHAMGSTFVAWLAEVQIMNVLQKMFDNTKLHLAGVTLADHGVGFTRHGAWSSWLGEKYGILPGLSKSIAMLPLPMIPLALPEQISIVKPEYEFTSAPPTIPNRRLQIAVLMTFCICLITGLYWFSMRDQDGVHTQQSLNALLKNLLEDNDTNIDEALFSLSGTAPLFENGSSILMPESERELAELVPKMMLLPQQTFLIIGHSDSTGSAVVNQRLSIKRARVIQEWLIDHTGLPANQFIIEGASDSRPLTSNTTKEGRAQNRRVEIIPLSTQYN
ncbi:OmpA family protein [Hafnia alvei]|uniref:OmpA family protein n=1 Tax=Hafnia alvei TaxID=569 RepID=A0ABD7Q6W8_HAFAL|nr:OmpA family protein [Hafnia alvei]TBL68515.1 OmpA family protein [Hafnia alvei]